MSEPQSADATDPFRLLRRDSDEHAAERRERLAASKPLRDSADHAAAARNYKLDGELESAVNMALAVGEPLLVTGEPGTGKTLLAWYLADYFDIEVRPFYVKSTSTAQELKYDFDAVGYLQSAYLAQTNPGEQQPREAFLEPGPLWRAYEDERPSVLLIDEIDKAPRDFPNDLLHELDQAWFAHPFNTDEQGKPTQIRPKAGRPPITIITSNLERRLPTPFLRRCIFHHIALSEDMVKDITDAHFPKLDPGLRDAALERFWQLQSQNLQKPPSTAELMHWLALLQVQRIAPGRLAGELGTLPSLGALIKDHEDQRKLRK